jgi:hypothetical protein
MCLIEIEQKKKKKKEKVRFKAGLTEGSNMYKALGEFCRNMRFDPFCKAKCFYVHFIINGQNYKERVGVCGGDSW